jgi:hypothetical protein
VIRAAPADEQALASAAVPTTQLIGGATGSAAAGARADLLGFAHGFRLFAAFTSLALAAAWRLGRG